MVKQFGHQGKGVFLRPSGVAEGFHYQDPSLRNPLLLFGVFGIFKNLFIFLVERPILDCLPRKLIKKNAFSKFRSDQVFPESNRWFTRRYCKNAN